MLHAHVEALLYHPAVDVHVRAGAHCLVRSGLLHVSLQAPVLESLLLGIEY